MRQLLTGVFLFLSSILHATDYYVKADGNNANTGLSDAQAWGTVSKVNTFSFPAGTHTVYFKRNGIWTDFLIVGRSNITFDAYDVGSTPLFSGFSTVTGWVSLGGNIWEAPVTGVKSTVNMVTRDGVIQQIGRYPNANAANSGYLTYTSSSNTSLTGSALSSVTNWTGAQVAIRQNRWTICKRTVASHSAGTITFSALSQAISNNYGYFFQRDSRTLDQDGEWWYDAANSKLRVYAGNNNPSAYTYKISVIDTLFKNMNYYANVTVKNLAFEGANTHAIFMYSASGQLVQNCTFNYSGMAAVEMFYCATSTVDNCTIKNSLGYGVRNYNNDYGSQKSLTVKYCNIDSTCMIAGMEKTDGQGGEAIEGRANTLNILNNTIKHCGYGGITWQGSNANINYNRVDSFCYNRDDGGGIYSYESSDTLSTYYNSRTAQRIIGNTISNALNANNGTSDANGRKSNGIYSDEGSRNIVIDSNIVFNCLGAGIIANSCNLMTYRQNILYQNTYSHLWERFQGARLIRDIVFTNNIVYPYKWKYANVQIDQPTLITLDVDMAALGTINNNYVYRNTGTDSAVFQRKANTGVTSYTEAYKNWAYVTGTISKETTSTVINAGNAASEIKYNYSAASITYYHYGYSKVEPDGTVHNGSTVIPAYGGKVLIDNGTCSCGAPGGGSGTILRGRKFKN